MKKIIPFLLIIFILTSCSSAPNENNTNQSESDSAPGTLTLYTATQDFMHPLYTKLSSNQKIYDLMYDSLICIASDMSIVPRLAEKSVISKDFTKICFTLKPGILWHDGKDFTSADVVYTINLILNEENPTNYTSRLSQYISRVQAEDDLNFSVYLKKPYARVLYLMDFPIVPANSGSDSLPAGTGKYKLESISREKQVNLTKNNLWTLDTIPVEDKLTVQIVSSDENGLSMLKTGELSAYDADISEIAEFGYADKIESLGYPSLNYEFLGFNFSNQVFADSAVRHAVSYLIDRDKISSEIYFGYAQSANSPVPPSAFFYNKEADKCTFSSDSASKALTDGGWVRSQNGVYQKALNDELYTLSASLIVNEDNKMRVAAANIIASSLNSAGMSITVEPLPFDTYVERLQSGQYAMFMGGTELSANLDFGFLLSSHGYLNFMRYSSEEAENAIQNTYTAVSTDSIKKAYLEFQYVFTNDCPITGIAFTQNVLLYRNTIKGISKPFYSRPYSGINKWHFDEKQQ